MAIEVSSEGQIISRPELNERSEAAEEIISRRPGFLIRHGSLIFLAILLLLAGACWLIKYPDHVPASARLTSINAPKKVICHTEGKLIKLLVKENDHVSSNAVIGFIESTADHTSVLLLDRSADEISALLAADNSASLERYFKNPDPKLGELQDAHQAFFLAYNNFKSYIPGGFYFQKKQALQTELGYLEALRQNLLQQQLINEKDIALSQQTFEMNETLRKDKVISENAYREERSRLLNKQMSVPAIQASIIQNDMLRNTKKTELMEIDQSIFQQKSLFQQSLNTLKSRISEWKMKYLLIAPVEGTVSFSSFFQENQQLNQHETICYITPSNTTYYAELYIPQHNFGKVADGQKVQLKFHAYPEAEFGQIYGNINFISRIPSDSGYLARVILPAGLTTTYNKKIRYSEGLTADADIIIQQVPLYRKIYYSLYSITN